MEVSGSTAIDREFRFISGTNALVLSLNVSTTPSVEEYNIYRAAGGFWLLHRASADPRSSDVCRDDRAANERPSSECGKPTPTGTR
jgi:hypothetical protein